MKDSTLNLQSVPVLYWPQATLDSEMAEVPLRSFNIGEHSNFGFGVETEWHLFRTLGLKPPEGVKANLTVDAFEKGTELGLATDYAKGDSVGLLRGGSVGQQRK